MSMECNRGRSALGLCHPKFRISQLVNSFQWAPKIICGWLDNFFNPKDSDNAITLITQPKHKFIRVHIINGPGMNNGRTCDHEITYNETTTSVCKKIRNNDPVFLGKFTKRLGVIKNIVERAAPGTLELAISPWLEREEVPEDVFKKLATICAEFFPNTDIVDNPRLPSTPYIPGPFLHERHGSSPPLKDLDIVDLDGEDFEFIDVPDFIARHAHLKACYLWGLGENGNANCTSWVPPEKRTGWTTSREAPVYKYFNTVKAAELQGEITKEDLAGVTKLHEAEDGAKKGFIWKLGEDKKIAVIIFPSSFRRKFKRVEVRRKGKTLDKCRFRAILNDGSKRLIYDCTKHPVKFPDNSLVFADGHAWVLKKPQFRVD